MRSNFRTLRECVYLREFETGFEAQRQIGNWMKYYNQERPHSLFADDRTPLEVYTQRMVV